MKSLNAKLLCAVTLCLFCYRVQSALYPQDDPTFGPGALTLDTNTRLVWLDLTVTLGLSYNQAEAAMEPGGQLSGFRHATVQEVLSLYRSAGIGEQAFVPQTDSGFVDVENLIGLIRGRGEQTALGVSGTLINGLAACPYISFGAYQNIPGYYVTPSAGGPNTLLYGLNTSAPDQGNWIVAVPEPSFSAFAVLAAAIGSWKVVRKQNTMVRAKT